MIRIALVEDDAVCREQLRAYLRQYERESGQRFHISEFTDGDEIAETYQAGYDIILMDIAMRFMDGMTAAQRIRAADGEVVIIFITETPQYAMEGYTVDALDYVLKPVSYYAFSQRIDRALKRMARRKRRYIALPVREGVKKLDVAEILYVEVRDHYLLYHTRAETILVRGALSDAEERLGTVQFFRCNKCYLINLEYVDGVENSDVLIGNERIQVSRARRKLLLDTLNDYINEVGK